MVMKKTYSEKLALSLKRITYDNLPEEVVLMAKRCFLDWLGCTIAARNEKPIRMIGTVSALYGGNRQATVVTTGEKTSAPLAAFVNGAAAHALEMDDVHCGSVTHPACVVISAAVAVGEREGIHGSRLIEAIVAGYDAMIRVGEAVGKSHYRLWHNTSTCGTFGSAVSAGKALGLTVSQYMDALGNAGSQAAGLWEFLEDGANTKFMHAGKAAMNGIIASDLAKQGFTGARRIFEGPRGFFLATSQDADAEKLVEGIDGENTGYRILADSFKLYPCCRHTHSSIDAAIKLVSEQKILPDDVKRVQVDTYSGAVDLCGGGEIKNCYSAKFHIPFAVATAIIYRKVRLESFSESRIKDRRILDLAGMVSVHVDSELDKLYPSQWSSRVTIHLRGGRSVHTTVLAPSGDPDNPPSEGQMEEKFRYNVQDIITGQGVEQVLEEIYTIDACENIAVLFNNLETFYRDG